MVVKVYISGISGNHEIRKQQQRVQFILSSLKINFEAIDITETGKEAERSFMREQCKKNDRPNALPPQIFNDTEYCGDFNDFEAATEEDRLRNFLKIENQVSTEVITLSSSGKEKGDTEELKDKSSDMMNEHGESEIAES